MKRIFKLRNLSSLSISIGVSSVEEVVRLSDLTKIYPLFSGDVIALNRISLTINKGEFVAIIGPSGSGKSTLLNQLGCLDVPTSGDLEIGGEECEPDE